MGDVASSFSSLFGGGDAGGSDLGNMFGGILPGLAGLFGGVGGSSPASAQAIPPIAPHGATPAIPDVSAPTPTSTSTAASAANPIPNAAGTIDPVTVPGGAGLSSVGPVDPGTVGQIAPAPNIGPMTQQPGILGQIFGGNGKGGQSNALKDILGAGVLGIDLARAGQTPPELKQMQAMAGTDAGTAKSFLAQAQGEGQGILPAGASALVQNNLDAQIAAIKNRYSQLHMSGSTAETQDINAAKSAALAQTFEIGNTLAQQGLSESNAASGQEDALLQAILAAETAQGTQLGDALAGFAGAAAK